MERPTDTRQAPRSCTIYKPARVDIDGMSYLALMTDISAGGAGLEAPIALRTGATVYLSTGDEPLRRASVVWSDGGSFGVRFDDEGNHLHATGGHGYRSVRVPCDIPARMFVRGVPAPARITNLSPRGLAIDCNVNLRPGAMVSLEVCGQTIDNVTIRWSRNGKAGARLPLDVKMTTLQRLILAAQARPATGTMVRAG